MANRKGTFKPGHDKRRGKGAAKPLMSSQREAMRMLKDLTPKAVRKLQAMLDSSDDKVQQFAVKLTIDKGLPNEVLANPWQVPEDVRSKPYVEQYAWALKHQQDLGELVEALRGAAEAEGSKVEASN